MTKIELSIDDQMDLLESQWYPEAMAFKTARLAVDAAKGLGELSRAKVEYSVRESNCNYIMDKWCDLRAENYIGQIVTQDMVELQEA